MVTIVEPHVPATPPELLPGRSSVEWVNRQLRWLFSVVVPLAALAASAFLLWDPWRLVGIWAFALVGIGCALGMLHASLEGWQAVRREHAAGYTTIFGNDYRYWQLEAKTGTVLRRPGERIVHREGIPRALLVQEAARSGTDAAADTDAATQ